MRRAVAILTIMTGLALEVGWGRQGQAPIADDTNQNEILSTDAAVKVQVNLVLVRVVAWDKTGKAVPGLKQSDFQIFDNGKRQKISSFNLETAAALLERPAKPATASEASPNSEPVENPPSVSALPQRFVALVFDDLHMKAADAMAVRAATQKLFASLTATDRVAIYSTGGDVKQDFTADGTLLRKTLADVTPHPAKGESQYECPNITYYQADLIVNKNDRDAAIVAAMDASANQCPTDIGGDAEHVLREGDLVTGTSYQQLESIVKNLASMPGQRVLVYVSPGFVLTDAVLRRDWEWIQQAVHSGVVVNTIDARGLYTAEPLPEIDAPPQQPSPPPPLDSSAGDYQAEEGKYRMQAQFQSGQVLAGMAASTGGRFFHNRNDLDVAMGQALAAPEVSYILGFRPEQPIKDGKFHNLKVKLANGKKYEIQATNGYYASKKPADTEEAAKLEVREALFSREEMSGIPLQVDTELLRKDAESTQLSVLTHIDVGDLRYRKADGRSCDDLVLATALFDSNGRLVDGQTKEIALRLQDLTLEKLKQTGLTFKMVFAAKPGTYRVRSVVRGSKQEPLTARSVTIVIPGAELVRTANRTPFQDLRWSPPKIDAHLKSLSTTPACDLADVLAHAGANALDLATNLEKFTAQEHIDYAMIDRSGIVEEYDSSTFQYVYSIEQQNGGSVSREYRNPLPGSHAFRAAGQHIGGVAIALMFLPDLQTDYEMKCEGGEQRNGIRTWVIDFQQRKESLSRTAKIWVYDVARPARFKGRAWIAQDNFQVVHLEVELVDGVPEIGLQGLAASVDYHLVQSSAGKSGMLLPDRVESYWDYDAHRVMLAHKYSDFEFFTVETKEKVQ